MEGSSDEGGLFLHRSMALTATIYNIDVELADVDRNVYDTLSLRMARHPSESEEYFVTRLLAYCLEYAEGIQFSNGISDPEEPTISVRDLTGAIALSRTDGHLYLTIGDVVLEGAVTQIPVSPSSANRP